MQDQTGESKITLQDPVATSIVKYSAAKIVNVLSDVRYIFNFLNRQKYYLFLIPGI